MKTLFKTIAVACAALFIGTTSVSAQQPSKSEIKETVTGHLENIYAYYNSNMPGTLTLECIELADFRETLDAKNYKLSHKVGEKWLKKIDDRDAFQHYIELSIGVMLDTQIEDYATEEAIPAYYDAIYSLKHAGYDYMANLVTANYCIFLYTRDITEQHDAYLEAYRIASPARHKIISPLFDSDDVLEEMQNWYEEDFDSMSQWDLVNCYIDHLDAVGENLSEGDMMEATRHTIVMGYMTDLITNSEMLSEAIATWFKTSENAEIVGEYFSK
jgi:hypothetical protein